MPIGSAVEKQEDPLLGNIAFIFIQNFFVREQKRKQQLRGPMSNRNIEHLLPHMQN